MCGYGGCNVISPTYYCPEHSDRIKANRAGKAYTTTRQKERREQGLCGYSGCSVETGDASYYCVEHRPVKRPAGE